ncbi:winged helix-turn-helix transcriptional regulator [Mesobacillus jeotgali]|uniref:winged helix-turn-helix transcriptional regulator n=1 Tax=Mesobacillus jeotgali TaxID=129985 RepID=UPI001CFD1D57|nr:helix-turn-helix domain-containing protein [Mesobacillus jeotgali]
MNYKVTKSIDRNNCPLTYSLNLIGGKWRLPILWALWKADTLRYNELKAKVEGITNMMLSQTLKEMERHGMILRKQYIEMPPRVEYSLTDSGKQLIPSLESLAQWGKQLQNNENNKEQVNIEEELL